MITPLQEHELMALTGSRSSIIEVVSALRRYRATVEHIQAAIAPNGDGSTVDQKTYDIAFAFAAFSKEIADIENLDG